MMGEEERETAAEDQGYRQPLPSGRAPGPLFPRNRSLKTYDESQKLRAGLVRIEYLGGWLGGKIMVIREDIGKVLIKQRRAVKSDNQWV